MITADGCKYSKCSRYEGRAGEYFSLVLEVWVSVQVTFFAHKVNTVLETRRENSTGEKSCS
jgi:hypothetical protein